MSLRSALRSVFGAQRRNALKEKMLGAFTHLDRVVLDAETDKLVRALPYATMSVLEASGDKWRNFGFAAYRSVSFPEYDLCADPLAETFDLIIAEQVFEHVAWPYRAGKNVYAMLKPGGYFLITTPFLQRVHEFPIDCSRWTPTGLKHLLAECGFPLAQVSAWSWGNRQAVREYLRSETEWPGYNRFVHSLKNERIFPLQVWALARK